MSSAPRAIPRACLCACRPASMRSRWPPERTSQPRRCQLSDFSTAGQQAHLHSTWRLHQGLCPKTWWHGFEETDHRHRRLLRVRNEPSDSPSAVRSPHWVYSLSGEVFHPNESRGVGPPSVFELTDIMRIGGAVALRDFDPCQLRVGSSAQSRAYGFLGAIPSGSR